MEFRTNNLFKSYLKDDPISHTPSPEPQVTKFRATLAQCEEQKLNMSISRLCTMMENCMNQLQMSNSMIEKLTSPDSDFMIVQKQQLKDFFSEFKHEFSGFKNEIRNNVKCTAKQEVGGGNAITKYEYTTQESEKSIFSSQPKVDNSQESIFPSLTPPSSFDKILQDNKNHPFSDALKCHVGPKVKNVREVKLPCPDLKMKLKSSQLIPNFAYKLEKKCKSQKKRNSQPQSRCSGGEKKVSSNRMRSTQQWLDSQSSPNFSPHATPAGKFKRFKSEDLSKWSSRSVRTVITSSKKRGNFVQVRRVAMSETGSDAWGHHYDRGRKCQSEW